MFVECDVEIKIKDKTTSLMDDHELKLWVQRSFKKGACYRIENFQKIETKLIKTTVALNTSVLLDSDRTKILSNPEDTHFMRYFVEKQWDGKGTLRAISEPSLKGS